MKSEEFVKIETYCPKDSVDIVRRAIGSAGGGIIGNYSHCAFVYPGYGYFMPLEGSNPTIGKHGEIAKVEEVKIDFICEKSKIKQVTNAIKKVHPYEKVYIGVFEMLNFEK